MRCLYLPYIHLTYKSVFIFETVLNTPTLPQEHPTNICSPSSKQEQAARHQGDSSFVCCASSGTLVLLGNSYLKVVQKVPKCDVTLLSIDNSDWSQKGKFNSCNIITLDV